MIEGTRETMAIRTYSREESLIVAKYYEDLGYKNRGIIPENRPEDYPYIYFREDDHSFTARRSPSDKMKCIIPFGEWQQLVSNDEIDIADTGLLFT